jgi:hypothetical protein
MFDRINRAVLRYIECKGGTPRVQSVEVVPGGFAVASTGDALDAPSVQTYKWNGVKRAVATKVPGWVGSDECVLVECNDRVIQLTAEVVGYDALLDAAPHGCAGWPETAQWRVKLLKVPDGEALELWDSRPA